MDKNKWKTYPCKLCLLKGKCSKRCFIYPPFLEVKKYIQDNNLVNECLGCGISWAIKGYLGYELYGDRGCKGGCDECTTFTLFY